MFEVRWPSPIQQYRPSKRKVTPMGTMEINPKRQKYDFLLCLIHTKLVKQETYLPYVEYIVRFKEYVDNEKVSYF